MKTVKTGSLTTATTLGFMSSVYAWIVQLTGWRRWGLSFLAGSLTALALPPFYYWPVLFVSFPLLVIFLDAIQMNAGSDYHERYRSAAAVGWWFGFGQFLFGLYWVAWAFLVDARTFAWLIPFAATLMPSLLALFVAAATGVCALVWRPGPGRVIIFAVLWTAFEWLRGHIFTGFPWNLMGYAVSDSLALSQFASIVGIYGLSFLVVITAAAPAAFLPVRRRLGRTWLLPAALVLGVAVLGYWGSARLLSNDVAFVPRNFVRIVQPAIAQKDKWRPENHARVFRKFMELTASRGFADRTLIVWPEAALPFLLDRAPDRLKTIVETLGTGRTLLTGAVRAVPDSTGDTYTFFNSLQVIEGADKVEGDPDAHIIASYDKHHLVPFGEYVPFADLFRTLGFAPIVDQVDGYTPGPGRRTLTLPGGTRVSPLICYEIIFPGEVTAPHDRPDWIVNVTNDAWYGDTTGPRQHLQTARLRAIETGLPVVRAANTGISAVFDPLGRRLGTIPLNEPGVLDVQLPAALPATLYARYGDLLFVGLMSAFMLPLLAVWFLPVLQEAQPAAGRRRERSGAGPSKS